MNKHTAPALSPTNGRSGRPLRIGIHSERPDPLTLFWGLDWLAEHRIIEAIYAARYWPWAEYVQRWTTMRRVELVLQPARCEFCQSSSFRVALACRRLWLVTREIDGLVVWSESTPISQLQVGQLAQGIGLPVLDVTGRFPDQNRR